ncbi:MAG TPA: right-handed parallel beta-helix repeat-containing protein, partial [Candidatus Eisenbacteria bacterium]
GGALQISGAQSVTIQDCAFARNLSAAGLFNDSSGGAIDLVAASVSIVRCAFTDNTAEGTLCGGSGGAVMVGGDAVTFTDCEFRGNSAADGGAVLAVGTTTFDGCRFIGNTASAGGGFCGIPAVSSVLHLAFGGEVRDCVFLNNTGPGSAVAMTGGSVNVVEHSTIAWNGVSSASAQPAVDLRGLDASSVDFRQNVVAFNRGGGIAHAVPASDDVACNIIWANNQDFVAGADWRGQFDNQASDPLFCSQSEPGISVAANSPCLAGGSGHAEGCGVIGTVEVGCPSVSVTPTTWSAIKARIHG